MALKDEASPKYTFSGAGTSLLKSYKQLAAGAEISVFTFLTTAAAAGLTAAAATATAAALAAAAAPGSKTPWP